MRRGTTPTYQIKISDMTNIVDVCLAFEQTSSGVTLYKHVSDNTGHEGLTSTGAFFTLTQAETSSFSKGKVKLQVKVKFYNGDVDTTDIMSENVVDVLHEEVF